MVKKPNNNRFILPMDDQDDGCVLTPGVISLTAEDKLFNKTPRSAVDSCYSESRSVSTDDDEDDDTTPMATPTTLDAAKTSTETNCTRPLETAWDLYYYDNEIKTAANVADGAEFTYEDYILLHTTGDVEDFLRTINHLALPTQLKYRSNPNYVFFRNGIKPAWEDEANNGGGTLQIKLKSVNQFDENVRAKYLDPFWIELLFALIGEKFTNANLITGMVLKRRNKEDRIEIWMRDCDEVDQDLMTAEIKQLLNLAECTSLPYTLHDAQKKNNEKRQYMSVKSPGGSVELTKNGSGGWNSRRSFKPQYNQSGYTRNSSIGVR